MLIFKSLIEQTAYGVCTKIGERIGLSTRRIRVFFIYTSFLTLGSPVIIYMILAFWINMKNYVREKRTAVWDL
jgi:phage shock protein PspC (stress-responsive transcriptional regulator)